jgi:hypothetical protein
MESIKSMSLAWEFTVRDRETGKVVYDSSDETWQGPDF